MTEEIKYLSLSKKKKKNYRNKWDSKLYEFRKKFKKFKFSSFPTIGSGPNGYHSL